VRHEANHLKVCPMQRVRCGLCGVEMLRQDLDTHDVLQQRTHRDLLQDRLRLVELENARLRELLSEEPAVLCACGGTDGKQGLDTTEVYNIALQRWIPRSRMRIAINHGAILALTDRVFVFGMSCSAQREDRCGGIGLAHDSCDLLVNNIGGYDGKETFNSSECFSYARNEWRALSSMRTARWGSECVFLQSRGQCFIIGGGDAKNNALASVEVYDIHQDRWITGTGPFVPIGSSAAVVAAAAAAAASSSTNNGSSSGTNSASSSRSSSPVRRETNNNTSSSTGPTTVTSMTASPSLGHLGNLMSSHSSVAASVHTPEAAATNSPRPLLGRTLSSSSAAASPPSSTTGSPATMPSSVLTSSSSVSSTNPSTSIPCSPPPLISSVSSGTTTLSSTVTNSSNTNRNSSNTIDGPAVAPISSSSPPQASLTLSSSLLASSPPSSSVTTSSSSTNVNTNNSNGGGSSSSATSGPGYTPPTVASMLAAMSIGASLLVSSHVREAAVSTAYDRPMSASTSSSSSRDHDRHHASSSSSHHGAHHTHSHSHHQLGGSSIASSSPSPPPLPPPSLPPTHTLVVASSLATSSSSSPPILTSSLVATPSIVLATPAPLLPSSSSTTSSSSSYSMSSSSSLPPIVPSASLAIPPAPLPTPVPPPIFVPPMFTPRVWCAAAAWKGKIFAFGTYPHNRPCLLSRCNVTFNHKDVSLIVRWSRRIEIQIVEYSGML
jgi:hypothetical protein